MLAELLENFVPGRPGWIFLWWLLLFLVFAVAIAIERALYIYIKSNINAPKFMAEIRKLVKAGEYGKALNLCDRAKDRALPRVISHGLQKVANSESVDFRSIQNSVDEGMLEVIPKLQQRTPFLAMIGNVATLMGLAGTIYGLILSFQSVSAAGIDSAEKARLLAAGISTAMNTTFMGLSVAIPTIVVYTFIHNKTTKIIDEIDEHTVKLINLITGSH